MLSREPEYYLDRPGKWVRCDVGRSPRQFEELQSKRNWFHVWLELNWIQKKSSQTAICHVPHSRQFRVYKFHVLEASEKYYWWQRALILKACQIGVSAFCFVASQMFLSWKRTNPSWHLCYLAVWSQNALTTCNVEGQQSMTKSFWDLILYSWSVKVVWYFLWWPQTWDKCEKSIAFCNLWGQ